MPPAENIERQITVTVVISVEEPPLLLTMYRIIRRIEVENDLFRRPLMRLQKQVDKEPLDSNRIMADLVVARRLQSAQLHPVERRLAGHRRTIFAPRFELARQYRHHRVMAQVVVVVQVLIAKRNPKHPLPNQSHNLVFDQILLSDIVKARREPAHHPNRTIRLAQE